MSEFSCLCADSHPVGPNHQSCLGVPWLLPFAYMVPSMYYHANSVDHPLSGRSLGRGWEANVGYGLPNDSAKHQCWGWPSLQSSCSVGTSPPRPLIHSGGGSPKVDATGGWWPRLAIHIYVHMSNTVLHAPLSDNGHISAMMDGICSVNACGQLHQLQVWKLPQHSDSKCSQRG